MLGNFSRDPTSRAPQIHSASGTAFSELDHDLDLAGEHQPVASRNVLQRDSPLPRVTLEHVNSVGVDPTLAPEKRSLGDTTFHLSSALALLIVRVMRDLSLP